MHCFKNVKVLHSSSGQSSYSIVFSLLGHLSHFKISANRKQNFCHSGKILIQSSRFSQCLTSLLRITLIECSFKVIVKLLACKYYLYIVSLHFITWDVYSFQTF